MPLPSFLVPQAPGAEDVACMARRVEFMEWLYERDGRSDPEHPHHGHYVGLVSGDTAPAE